MFIIFSYFFQQELNSCFKKATGWSCWHRFCDVEISRSDLDVSFFVGSSGGENHVQMLLHWTKSKVTTFWDVLLNGANSIKIPSFTDEGIFWHQEFRMVCLMDILCIMTTVWVVEPTKMGFWMLNCHGETRREKSVNLTIIHRTFARPFQMNMFPSWWFKAGCNVTSTSGLRRHQHNDYHEFIMTSKKWWSSTEFWWIL